MSQSQLEPETQTEEDDDGAESVSLLALNQQNKL